jgi:hypothetical protein
MLQNTDTGTVTKYLLQLIPSNKTVNDTPKITTQRCSRVYVVNAKPWAWYAKRKYLTFWATRGGSTF